MGKQSWYLHSMIVDLATIQQYHFLVKIILLKHTLILKRYYLTNIQLHTEWVLWEFQLWKFEIFRYCLPCNMNCLVVYLVFRAKLELQNDNSFVTTFSLELTFKLLFSDISTFWWKLKDVLFLNWLVLLFWIETYDESVWVKEIILVLHYSLCLPKMQKQ